MKITLVAALDESYGIGLNNEMPWHLPDDFKQFKAYTLGKPVIMGRLTADSLGRALPGRENFVLTRSGQTPYPGMVPVSSLQECLASLRSSSCNEVCVIGGGQVFSQALPLATDLHLTWVDANLPADARFPAFNINDWRVVSETVHPQDGRHAFSFSVKHYVRP